MAIQLTDVEIISLLSELKALPSDYQSRLQLRAKTGHKERELETKGYDPVADVMKSGIKGSGVFFQAKSFGQARPKPSSTKSTRCWRGHYGFTAEELDFPSIKLRTGIPSSMLRAPTSTSNTASAATRKATKEE